MPDLPVYAPVQTEFLLLRVALGRRYAKPIGRTVPAVPRQVTFSARLLRLEPKLASYPFAPVAMVLPQFIMARLVPYVKWTVPKIVLPARLAIISAPLHRWGCRHALKIPAHAQMESPPPRLEPPEQLYVKSILWLIALHVRLDTA
jgi:hypothetical protein